MTMSKLTISKYAAIGFILLLVVVHILNSSVDPRWQPISEYSIGNAGWLMKIAFALLGICFLFLGLCLLKSVPKTGSKIGGVLLIISSIGNLLAGIFNTDPTGTLPENMTTSGQIHNGAAGLLGLMILATVFITFQFMKQAELRPYKNAIIISTLILWLVEFILIGAMGYYLSKTNGLLSPETPIGWLGRFVIVLCALWCWICADKLSKASFYHENN
jgi:hypothetical membrane protein